MTLRRLFVLLALLAPFGLAAEAMAKPNQVDQARRPTLIDPELFLLRHALEHTGPGAAMFGTQVPIDPHHARVLLRFERECERQEVDQLARLGGMFLSMKEDGSPFGVGTVYRAVIPWAALERLYTLEGLVFAESLWSPRTIEPLEVTGPMTGAHQIQQLPTMGFAGRGVTIVDIDSSLDVLHPAFFRADGDSFAWVDQDGDGVFLGRGQDALDYDKNGVLDPHEALKVLDAVSLNRYTRQIDGQDGLLQAGEDWVYLDLNQNGQRDTGAALFTENTPGYGEPIFVVDDANKDGILGPQERLVQLKTSKIRRFRAGQKTWTRGVDLITSATEERLEDASHGTGVTGIILGGQPLYHRRHGLAPEAEVIVSSHDPGAPRRSANEHGFRGLEEATTSRAQIVLHEWTLPFTEPLDGSTNLEAAMDASFASGTAQVSPVGNLNAAGKHVERPLRPGEPVSLGFVVGPGLAWGNQVYPYSVLYGSVQWKGTQTLGLTVTDPLGASVVLSLSQPNHHVYLGQAIFQSATYLTSRGNTMTSFYLYNQNQQLSLAQGTWKMEVTGVTQPSTLIGRISDYYSSWGPGVGWSEPTMDRGTVVFPSSADSAFGVAAFGGRHAQDDGTGPGDLRGYSGRGPRLDGLPVVDITAPDDPFAPMASTKALVEAGYGTGWYSTFGGTSGAGPHVAAAMALLLEQDATRSPQSLYDLVRNSADAPGPTFKAEDWGAGKLNIYQALFQEPLPLPNQPPVAFLQVRQDFSDPLNPKVVLDATASLDPENLPLEATFDLDHDGTFDLPWGSDLQVSLPANDLPLDVPLLARVEVRDASGERHGHIATFTLTKPEPPMEPMPDPDMGVSQPDIGPSRIDMEDAFDMTPGQETDDMAKTPAAPTPDMGDDVGKDEHLVLLPPAGGAPGENDSGCGCGQGAGDGGTPGSLALLWGAMVVGLARRGRRLT